MEEENKNHDIKLRSEEVQEILTKMPHWMIRWGNSLILILVVFVIIFSFFIKYPDIIRAPILITTSNPPQRLVAKSNGRIAELLVKDKKFVENGTAIAILENSANYKDVFHLKEMLDTINADHFRTGLELPLEEMIFLNLGSLQPFFSRFESSYLAYEINKKLQPHEVEQNFQKFEEGYLKERLTLLQKQQSYALSELELRKKEINRFKVLYEKGVISSQNFEEKKLGLIQSERNYRNVQAEISRLESSLNNFKKSSKDSEINNYEDDIQLSRDLYQKFNELQAEINEWELRNVFRSSIDGQVSYMRIWSRNQLVESGDFVFTIIPSKYEEYIGRIEADLKNSGKIRKGQDVNMHLDNYPDNEYGVLKGNIKSISLVPDKEGKLYINVQLKDGLKTSYNQEITFQQEMTGTADILTEDLRLIERVFYQFKDLYSR